MQVITNNKLWGVTSNLGKRTRQGYWMIGLLVVPCTILLCFPSWKTPIPFALRLPFFFFFFFFFFSHFTHTPLPLKKLKKKKLMMIILEIDRPR